MATRASCRRLTSCWDETEYCRSAGTSPLFDPLSFSVPDQVDLLGDIHHRLIIIGVRVKAVYFPVSVASEVLISDINLRVAQAFTMHGIEIPYQYINILQPTPGEQTLDHGSLWKKTPHRGRQIADIVVDSHGHGMQEAIDETAALGTECGLEKKDTLRLRLLSEELFGLMKSVVGNVSGHYWVDQEDQLFAIHLETDVASMDREMRRQLLSVSSSGQNAAATGLIGKIRDMISVMILPREGGKNEPAALLPGSGSGGNAGSYVWSMQKHKQEIR